MAQKNLEGLIIPVRKSGGEKGRPNKDTVVKGNICSGRQRTECSEPLCIQCGVRACWAGGNKAWKQTLVPGLLRALLRALAWQ